MGLYSVGLPPSMFLSYLGFFFFLSSSLASGTNLILLNAEQKKRDLEYEAQLILEVEEERKLAALLIEEQVDQEEEL